MNKQQLASKIWASANKMRSKIEPNEYKDYILGFIFYRYLSTEIENFYRNEGWTHEDLPSIEEENDPEYTEYVQKTRGYFIGYNKLPELDAERGRFAKLFKLLSDHISAARLQGFSWEKQKYAADNGDIITMQFIHDDYLTLAARYRELYEGGDGGS